MKYCVYSRCYFENNYLTYFIEHYINLGFHKIIILHTGGCKYDLPIKYSNLVDIHYLINNGNENEFNSNHDHIIKKSDFDWVLWVDNDELLLLCEKYKTIDDYVNEKLLINNNINAFYFRWGNGGKI